jgi:hypothetical protein
VPACLVYGGFVPFLRIFLPLTSASDFRSHHSIFLVLFLANLFIAFSLSAAPTQNSAAPKENFRTPKR